MPIESSRSSDLKKAEFFFQQKNYQQSALSYLKAWKKNKASCLHTDIYQMLLSLLYSNQQQPPFFIILWLRKISYIIKKTQSGLAHLNQQYSYEKRRINTINCLISSPNNISMYFFLASQYFESGKLNEALDYYNLILSLNSQHMDSQIQKATTLSSLRRYKESLSLYETILSQTQNQNILNQYNKVKALSMIDQKGT